MADYYFPPEVEREMQFAESLIENLYFKIKSVGTYHDLKHMSYTIGFKNKTKKFFVSGQGNVKLDEMTLLEYVHSD